MFYKQIEQNPATGRFHIVTIEETSTSWGYVRKSSGLTLKTQNLDYYFHGIQESGYKTEKGAKNALNRISI
jgi:hypothetical protein